jgi:uncharacterized membrane protein YhaH (DUF805 family)
MERETNSGQAFSLMWMLFSAQGRLTRKPFWLFGISWAIIEYILTEIEDSNDMLLVLITALISIVLLIASIFVGIKRSHDRGRSGWFTLLWFIPIVCLWPGIEFGFLRGTVGDNKYGQDPLEQYCSEVNRWESD